MYVSQLIIPTKKKEMKIEIEIETEIEKYINWKKLYPLFFHFPLFENK